jgi:hypothetical protein
MSFYVIIDQKKSINHFERGSIDMTHSKPFSQLKNKMSAQARAAADKKTQQLENAIKLIYSEIRTTCIASGAD